MTDPSDITLIYQKIEALKLRDEDARKAIAALCGRVAVLEESSELHHLSISHCTHCKPELRKPELHPKNTFES